LDHEAAKEREFSKRETHEARTPSRASCFVAFAGFRAFVVQTLSDVSALEAEIDQRVYALYGLTAEEIRMVEGEGR
jgi:hypothetical protein